MPYVLALDEGTTSARAALYNERGECLAMHAVPFASRFPKPGWVEQDAREIWSAQIEALRAVIRMQGISAKEIGACGITNQRETVVVWDRLSGRPVSPAIVWQCRRTADACAALASSPYGPMIERKTGLVIDAYFSASKIRWILENVPGAREKADAGELLFGNIDTWLIWNLTGGAAHVTDHSNASRTMLMDLQTGEWDDELLGIFEVPRSYVAAHCFLVRARRRLRALSPPGPRFRSAASRAINRRHSRGRPASARGFRKTHTAPGVSR